MIDVDRAPLNIGSITHMITDLTAARGLSPMKIYDISLKRLTHKLKRVAKDARKEGQSETEEATRHTTLHKDHSHSMHGARRATPRKNGAKLEGEPRTEKALRPKTAGLRDNTQRVEKPWTTHLRTHRVYI